MSSLPRPQSGDPEIQPHRRKDHGEEEERLQYLLVAPGAPQHQQDDPRKGAENADHESCATEDAALG